MNVTTKGQNADGIYTPNCIEITNSTVNVTTQGASADGIYANNSGQSEIGSGNVTISGGTVTVTCTGENSTGIFGSGDVSVTNCELKINSTGDGIQNFSGVSINNCTSVTIQSEGYGITASKDVTLTGSRVDITASKMGIRSGKGAINVTEDSTVSITMEDGFWFSIFAYKGTSVSDSTLKIEGAGSISADNGSSLTLEDGANLVLNDTVIVYVPITVTGDATITGGTLDFTATDEDGELIVAGNPITIEDGGSLTVNGKILTASEEISRGIQKLLSDSSNVAFSPEATGDEADVKAYRKVKISAADGVTTNPGAGDYYVSGSQDFTFTAVFADGAVQKVFAKGYYSQKTVELEAKRIDRYTYQYTLHKVTEPWTISFGSAANAGETGTEAVAETRIWSYGNALHISAANDTEAAVYSITGALVKTFSLSAGEAAEPLERGVYIVKADGKTEKVVIR